MLVVPRYSLLHLDPRAVSLAYAKDSKITPENSLNNAREVEGVLYKYEREKKMN
jgi:hypothetical protein